MAITVTKYDHEECLVFVVSAAQDGHKIPNKPLTISHSAIAEGVVDVKAAIEQAKADAQVRLDRFIAAQKVIEEL